MKKRRGPITFNGETRTQTEWAKLYNMPINRLHARLRYGWSMRQALTTPRTARGPRPKSES